MYVKKREVGAEQRREGRRELTVCPPPILRVGSHHANSYQQNVLVVAVRCLSPKRRTVNKGSIVPSTHRLLTAAASSIFHPYPEVLDLDSGSCLPFRLITGCARALGSRIQVAVNIDYPPPSKASLKLG